MIESWECIKGYDVYQISSLGRVKSFKNPLNPKIISCRHKKDGYMDVGLYGGLCKKRFRIHRLVAEAFIPNPENKKEVNHKDGNRKNNSVDNLEWATTSENVKHSYQVLKRASPLKGRATRAKPVNQISLSGILIKRHTSIVGASRETGICLTCIKDCLRGKQKEQVIISG